MEERDPGAKAEPEDGVVAFADGGLRIAEKGFYLLAGAVLIAVGAVLLVQAVATFVADLDEDVVVAATTLLGTLLLAFVFVELLGAVRATVREGRLVAEPFLLVGIIAAIKELVIVAGSPKEEQFDAFRDAMIEIGVLAVVILLLAIAVLLVRRREREPAEGSAA
jgi:uncharacterized membrane protein (DUF373 family)